jgi:choline-sulfatase
LTRAGVLLVAAVGAASTIGCGSPAPDVLVITLDTTRADRMGYAGDKLAHTPNIDALAARGFAFERHLTPVPITLPSHTTIFTGLTPPSHGARDNGTFVAKPELHTLAELFVEAGWRTAAFIGAFPLEARFGLDQGFATYDDDLPAEGPGGAGVYFPERPASVVIGRAMRHLRELPANDRAFTWVHLFDPHQPQLPPAPWDLRFAADGYRGEIASADEQIGRLLATLAELGRLDRTVVVLTADHGEGLGEHGELTHGMLLHQATLHVPLVIAGPGVAPGRTREWTSSTQLFETLAELADLEPLADPRRGRSLLPLVANGGTRPANWPRFSAYFETLAPRTSVGWSQLTAWMDGSWRLVHGPTPGLWDLEADPNELVDRFADDPTRGSALFERLAAFLAAEESVPAGAAAQEIDPETRAQLEALGYLQGGADLSELSDMLAVAGLPDPRVRAVDISVFSEAKAAMARNQWPRAQALWRQVLVSSPKNQNAWQGLAIVAAVRGDIPGALGLLQEALTIEDGAATRRLLGSLLYEAGAFGESAAEFAKLEPSPDTNSWRGRAAAASGDLVAAEAAYREGLTLDPEHQWLRLYLANHLARSGRHAEAEVEFRRLLEHKPWFGLGWYNFALLLSEGADSSAALPATKRAAELLPGHTGAQALLARLDSKSTP